MKALTFCLSLLLIAQVSFAQSTPDTDSYAIVSFENKGSIGDSALYYYLFNELGKSRSNEISQETRIGVRKNKYDFIYLSNTFDVTAQLYLKAGDSVRLIQDTDNKIRFFGSHESEFKLLEILYENNIMTFQTAKDIPMTQSLRKNISFTNDKIAQANKIIDSFTVANPMADKEILEMIRIDAKYRHLNGMLLAYVFAEYLPEDHELIEPILDQELGEIAKFSNPYNYGPSLSWTEIDLGLSLYKNREKRALLRIGNRGYAKQMVSLLEFYRTLPLAVQEDFIYYTLVNFLGYKVLEGIDVENFTKPFYEVAKNPERITIIKNIETKIKDENDAEKQAEVIIRGDEMRAIVLNRPDGTKTTFGELFDRLKGQGIYLDIWATWCAPCRVEMNKLDADFIKGKDHQVVFLSIDDDADKWKSTVKEQYIFENVPEHYRIDINNLVLQKLLGGYVSVPKYIYVNPSQTKFNKDVLKPTLFGL